MIYFYNFLHLFDIPTVTDLESHKLIGVDEFVRTLRSPDAVKTIKIPVPKCRFHPQFIVNLFCETCNEPICPTYVLPLRFD